MPRYQIRFVDKDGCGVFKYFDADDNIEQRAADVATDYMNQRMASYDLPRTVNVWEMDVQTKEPKKKGHRFKIRKTYVQATTLDGGKTRDEWYEPIL